MTTPAPDAYADARLERIITAFCDSKVTRQECVEEMRYLRSLLPKAEREQREGSGASWPQARAFGRLAPDAGIAQRGKP